jgi:capsular polysaccharide transport system permease protein
MHALFVRELMLRYGRGNIGFLWLVLEPMILCLGVVGIRYVIQAHLEHGVSLVGFLLSGYMPLTLWRHLTNRGVHLASLSGPMLYHHEITLVDIFFTTMIMEFVGCSVAFTVNYLALYAIGAIDPIVDYGLVCIGWATMGVLASGFAAIFMVLTEVFDVAERFVQPVQYLLLPISGFLFMVDWLPDDVQYYAWFMPMVHCYEVIRAGFFGPTVQTYYDLWYPLAVGGVAFAVAVPMIERLRDRLAA